MTRHRIIAAIIIVLLLAGAGFAVYRHWFAPTRILVVNPLPAQAAELRLNADSRLVDVTCVPMEEAGGFDRYDAVLMYGRGLYLDSLQMADLAGAARKGVKVFTSTLRNFNFVVDHNIDDAVRDTLQMYFRNPCRANYVNLVRYVRAIATPHRFGSKAYEPPVILPDGMFWHLEPGRYFKDVSGLEAYLREEGLWHEGAPRVAFISGMNFPVEGNRAHIDTLISRLGAEGFNVLPLTASGKRRERMLREAVPDAIVYLPMGRLGNDSLVGWCYDREIPLFMPFPLIQTREEWLDVNKPVSAGTLNARIVVPEIDGAMTPLCISTQDPSPEGLMLYRPDPERINAFVGHFSRYMALRDKPNRDKRVAIGYFKTPGRDALLASGMEVIPSLYNFLCRLRDEGYDVTGLPATLEGFRREIMVRGSVMGDYASAAQQRFMDEASPVWIDTDTYRQWASEILLPEKYEEVERHYGPAPGTLLARGDSLAVAAIRYGNILLFPQPRPAIGDDDFKMAHGAEVPPPHSYLAAYLYMQKGFDADALIHFGTHGNLEFTPGKNAALSQADWADVLIGHRPHFYFYTTSNVGEAVIAKRRSHAVLVTHLTPPFVESGMRQKYASLLDRIHAAINDPAQNTPALKSQIISIGLHKDLRLDSIPSGCYTADELRTLDGFVEELSDEKITGAYYVMGQPYSQSDMVTTLTAICADRIAYDAARHDRDAGRITDAQLHDNSFVSHRYLPAARRKVMAMDDADVLRTRDMLSESPSRELDAMVGALSGRPVRPAPGGDPVLNPEVLPTGRNMYSINAEATPGHKAWEDGARLADRTLEDYVAAHGGYPRKVSYTLWAGEFISTKGATIAQALRMLGVEPVRDGQGRVIDLKLTPSSQLGRPRVDVMVQVSGQLRDIAASRLLLITDAVRLAASAKDDLYPNYVAEGTLGQEKAMVEAGTSPKDARRLSVMRVFGPVNSGYSTGMLSYTENSGSWDDRAELAEGYVNNMCALYGDTLSWGSVSPEAMRAAVSGTAVIVQPRQSNTWGPISLDHVYEFAGGLSMLTSAIDGCEPELLMADYRNPSMPRMQQGDRAVAVETRATLLNPAFIRERMKGDATTAQMFGEIARNIFGWNVMRPSVLPPDIYDEMFDVYVRDIHGLGVAEYFDRVNPAALQEMTATMLESARKGFWHPTSEQLSETAALHARVTADHGAPCTEFVCANTKLQRYIAGNLPDAEARGYERDIAAAVSAGDGAMTLAKERDERSETRFSPLTAAIAIAVAGLLCAILVIARRRRESRTR